MSDTQHDTNDPGSTIPTSAKLSRSTCDVQATLKRVACHRFNHKEAWHKTTHYAGPGESPHVIQSELEEIRRPDRHVDPGQGRTVT